jgi:hypothetical protein
LQAEPSKDGSNLHCGDDGSNAGTIAEEAGMKIRLHWILSGALALAGLLAVARLVEAQESTLVVHIEDVMTTQELRDSGVSNLSATQRQALNIWLNRYTVKVIKAIRQKDAGSTGPSAKGSCIPAIESTLIGDFNGWEGETIFKLDNGQIWEQAEYDYNYSYSYRPDVTIYQTSEGCRMKVEDEDETILVRRVR